MEAKYLQATPQQEIALQAVRAVLNDLELRSH